MPTFTPPAVPEGTDIMGHIWATRHAIQSWFPGRVRFEEIRLHEDLRFELATHERLQRSVGIDKPSIDSIWGMKINFNGNWTHRRCYTITYQEA